MFLSAGESFVIDCDTNESDDMNYKWFINEKELFSENGKTLQIEHFVAAYDKSVVKCAGEGKSGEIEDFKLVKLNLDITQKEPLVLASHLFVEKNNTKIRSKKIYSRKTIFSCIAEEEHSEQPSYVWIDRKIEGKAVAEDDENRKFNCEVVPRGYNKLNQMSKKVKFMSKSIKKSRQSLNQIITTI